MSSIDPVANLLTKIRNASRARHATTDVPSSQLALRILAVLKQEGFIRNYKPAGQPPKQLVRIYLKYASGKTPAIIQLVRVSRPGQRAYRGAAKLPRVLGTLGRAIVSTSKGVMTDQEAWRQHVGGEVLCYVW